MNFTSCTNTSYGGKCDPVCDHGLYGDPTAVCGSNGSWTYWGFCGRQAGMPLALIFCHLSIRMQNSAPQGSFATKETLQGERFLISPGWMVQVGRDAHAKHLRQVSLHRKCD